MGEQGRLAEHRLAGPRHHLGRDARQVPEQPILVAQGQRTHDEATAAAEALRDEAHQQAEALLASAQARGRSITRLCVSPQMRSEMIAGLQVDSGTRDKLGSAPTA